jgi:hypothetical protein
MKRLFIRCNGGHYFQGANCPFDGWGTLDGTSPIVEALHQIEMEGADVSIAELLKRATLSPTLISRIVIIDFGDDAAVFDALAPDRYVYRGQQLMWHQVPLALY